MDRETLQGLAAHKLAKSHRLICQWATGTGKSNVALKFLQANPEMTCLILVPEQNNIENWTNEFTKFGVPMELVRVVCYASLHKYQNTKWDLLVFDEAPHMDTEKRKAICHSVSGEYVLALGAVIDKEETEALESVYGQFYKSYVGLKQAISWGILPQPRVKILHIKLDDTVRKYRGQGVLRTALGHYHYLNDQVDKAVLKYNATPNPFTQKRMYLTGSTRKRFLGQQKGAAIAYICAALREKGKRFLCFCSSIKQAEELGGENAFTSKSPVSMQHLAKFNNHEIDSLFVVGKLIEGQNLVDIDCGIIGQLGGTSRITVQEVGRVIRSQKPIIYIPVFDGTKDESFLYTLTSNVPEEYIKHINIACII